MVALIGRPNVGKSAIFNRLAGRRIAIVHEEPGVTRDRIVCAIRRDNLNFDLVDTGGLADADIPLASPAAPDEAIENAARRQVELTMKLAKAIVLVVDIRSGRTVGDEKTVALLRKSDLPVIVAANKADNAELELHAAEFEKFGFPVFPVSALHGRGFEALLAKLGEKLPPAPAADEEPRLRIAFVGRPNVGKSMLINRLVKSERVIVSAQPGTTRDSVDIPLDVKTGALTRKYVLTDTAGLRHGKKIKDAVESFSRLRAEKNIAAADIVALVIDAVKGPTAYDKTIAAKILEHKKGCLLIVNKCDRMARNFPPACRGMLHRDLPFMDFAPAVCASAATSFNIRHILETVNHVAEQNRIRISTGILNRTLAAAWAHFQPPFVRGGRLKIYYATQIDIQPISFLLFVNDPVKIAPSYEKYLENSLRKAFGFEGAPIVFKYKKRSAK